MCESKKDKIREELADVIGIYPLLTDGTCRFLVFDFDNYEKDAEKSILPMKMKNGTMK